MITQVFALACKAINRNKTNHFCNSFHIKGLRRDVNCAVTFFEDWT